MSTTSARTLRSGQDGAGTVAVVLSGTPPQPSPQAGGVTPPLALPGGLKWGEDHIRLTTAGLLGADSAPSSTGNANQPLRAVSPRNRGRKLNHGNEIASTVAGRTDAACMRDRSRNSTCQTASPRQTARRIGFHMKPHQSSCCARPRAADWMPAFAIGRTYRYRAQPPRPPALASGLVYCLYARRRRNASPQMLGRHDFTSFRAAACRAKARCARSTAWTCGAMVND